jgi:flagellar hook assembly protein FlgD
VGSHSIQWDGTNESGVAVASGLYIYKLQSAGFVLSKKMLILR